MQTNGTADVDCKLRNLGVKFKLQGFLMVHTKKCTTENGNPWLVHTRQGNTATSTVKIAM